MTEITETNEITSKNILIFFAMALGMFMAILDIQIVASSLSIIGAGLSASSSELSWIQTAYLIAEVMIIPVTGFLSRLLSVRIAYFIATAGFTVMSFCCSIAWNIESMIIFRGLQGLFGGAMIPTVFGTIFIIFPRRLHAKVGMVIGLIVTVAPTLGPTLGGYITEHLSWHFMFLINIIPGIFVCFVSWHYIDIDKPNRDLLKNFDLLGLVLMSFSLGCLEYVLEEGNSKDWFQSPLILSLSILVFFTLIYLIWHELTYSNPIIDLSAFKHRNFTLGCIYSLVLGVGLYGVVYLMPLFLFTISGYNTLQIGSTMMITGLFQFVSAPIAAKMMDNGVDRRIILSIGLGLFSLGSFANSYLTVDSGYWDLFAPQMIRGFALMFCFMPLNDIALGQIPQEEIHNASGLYNLTRNLGGAFGLAFINNLITSYSHTMMQNLNEALSFTSPYIQQSMNSTAEFFTDKVSDANAVSHYILHNIIQKEAYVIAMNNIYMVLAWLFLAATFIVPLSSKIDNNAAGGYHGH